MTQITRKSSTYWSPLYPGKSVLKSKGRSIWISNIWKYLTWLKLQKCKQFYWFKNTKKIWIWKSSVFQKLLLEKDMISFQIEASHLHIAPKSEMTVSTRDRLHNSTCFFKSRHPLSHWLCIVHQQWWEDMKNKVIPTQNLHLHQHQHQWCLQIGTLHHLCEMSGLIHNMLG